MRSLMLSSCLYLSSFLMPILAQPGTDGKLEQPETISTVRTDGSLKKLDELVPARRRLVNGMNEVEIDLAIEAGSHTTVAATLLQTRLLGGGLPGNTIRVRRGDSLIVNFENKLEEQPGTNTVLNEYSFPDYANLHFHGTHVSGEAPADDTTIMVPPGGSYRYRVDFPEDHTGGTYWLHTHVHGAGTLHVGGGAALPFIVEDEPGDVPTEVENAEEVILMVQNFDRDEFYDEVKPISGDKLFMLEPAEGVDNDFLLVNGQYRPTLDVTAGQWQRWRVIFGAWNKKPLDLAMATGGSCQMNLLAKDGIYIQDYPRALDLFPIPVGGRADIMVRCETAGVFFVTSYLGELFRLNVVEPDNGVVEWNYPTSGFDFFRPSYLSYDVIDSEPSPGCSCNTWMDNDRINDLPYNPGFFLHKTARGSTVERTVEGVSSHPYHQHVYPYQLKQFFYDDDADEDEKENDMKYFKVGDYQDSLTLRSSDMVKIQYVADTFNGRIAVHCHRITHSDVGMLATEIVLDDGVCECSPRVAEVGLTLPPTSMPVNMPPTNMPTDRPVQQFVGSSKSKKSKKKKDKKSKANKKN